MTQPLTRRSGVKLRLSSRESQPQITIITDFYTKDGKCAEAKAALQRKLEEFGNDYFYTLGLNLKFCSGIRNFMKNETLKSQYSKPISKIFQHWQKQNCSKSGKANSELEIHREIGFLENIDALRKTINHD